MHVFIWYIVLLQDICSSHGIFLHLDAMSSASPKHSVSRSVVVYSYASRQNIHSFKSSWTNEVPFPMGKCFTSPRVSFLSSLPYLFLKLLTSATGQRTRVALPLWIIVSLWPMSVAKPCVMAAFFLHFPLQGLALSLQSLWEFDSYLGSLLLCQVWLN